MLPPGVAVWPGSAIQVASWVWLPSRFTTTIASLSWWAFTGARHTQLRSMNVPQCWLLSDTVEASAFVPTWDIGRADTLACGGGDVAVWPAMPTNRPVASTAAAAAPAVHVTMRERCRRRRTVASNDGNRFGGSTAWSPALIAVTVSPSSLDSRAGMPLSSATACPQNGQPARCASNSRRSAGDNDPSTYAASHVAYSWLSPVGMPLLPGGP